MFTRFLSSVHRAPVSSNPRHGRSWHRFVRDAIARRGRSIAVLAIALTATACTFTPPQRSSSSVPLAAINSAALDRYRDAVARRIQERNPSYVLSGTPQAMLRSLVVVSFTVDRDGRVVASSVYRTNGDDEAESTALSSLRRSAPLPQPPARLLDGRGRLELMEDWLFNDDGKFQLRTLASPQAQTID